VRWTKTRSCWLKRIKTDYSFAGYHASEQSLPDRQRPASAFLSPTGDKTDRTVDIQSALDRCPSGGIVELQAGNYVLSHGNITLPSGCTLRGVLETNKEGDPAVTLEILGEARQSALWLVPVFHLIRAVFILGTYEDPTLGCKSFIADEYVPVGGKSFSVSDASGFNVGDRVVVVRTVSEKWIHAMVRSLLKPWHEWRIMQGMDKLVRNGVPQIWLNVSTPINQYRRIASINNNLVQIDFPLTDAIDAVRPE
jgi:hypothetical protein